MPILSHRGYWIEAYEKNTKNAFVRSFDLGLGTETDLRDRNGEVVVAHDPAVGEEMTFRELLDIMDGRNLTLALNIKSDGLALAIQQVLKEFKHDNYFTFDMSVPELRRQVKFGLKVFTGLSDLQPRPVLLEQSVGVWLDCFESVWYDGDLIDKYISQGFKVCVVSEDLHGREPYQQWEMLHQLSHLESEHFYLCTDKPIEAREYLGI